MHDSSLIRSFSARILHVVEAFAVRLPNIDLDTLYRLAGHVLDVAEDKARLAIRVVRYLGTVGLYLSFVGVEGPEDCAFCALRRFRVVDAVDEEGETEDVGEEDELLS